MEQLRNLLDATMSANQQQRQSAEQQLRAWADMVDQQPGLCQALLEVSTTNNMDPGIRHAGAIFFKNLVKGHWDPNRHDHVVMDNDKAFVRANLLDTMLMSPEYLRKTFGEAINLICEVDFPTRWGDLMGAIAQKLDNNDPKVIEGALSTAHSVFERYQSIPCLSPALVAELQQVNKVIAMPLLCTLETARDRGSISIARRCVDVFYDLCFLDFGDEIDDHLGRWMSGFLALIKIDMPKDEEQRELVAELKGSIIRTLALFITKYDDEFTDYLEAFCQAIWDVIQHVSADPMDDPIAIGAMDFLTAAMKGMHFGVFRNPELQQNICANVIIPNVMMRESDLEMFQADAGEYIQRDIEGSDVHTRRRAACELAQALFQDRFEGGPFNIMSGMVESTFRRAVAAPAQNWRDLDAVLYLVMQLANRSSMGALHASNTVRQLLNLSDLYGQYILPELSNTSMTHPVLKADAIKFVCCFRQQIPKQQLLALLPALANWIKSDNEVIMTYTAHAIDRLLNAREGGFQKADLTSSAIPLTEALVQRVATLTSPNDRVARALYRVIRVVGSDIDPIVGKVATLLNQQLISLAKNPTNPNYNHNMFESVSALATHHHERHLSSLEGLFWSTFMDILANQVEEFMPYVFQIIAQFVEYRPELNDQYVNFFAPLVTPDLYRTKRLIPSLVRLLTAYVKKVGNTLHAVGHTEGILNVFQMLISSKATDHEGFTLLSAMTETYPADTMCQYFPTILKLFFTRLTAAKTTKFIRCLILYLSLFVVKIERGANVIVNTAEQVQAGVFRNLFENIWLPDVAKVVGGSERKLCMVALTKFVSECDPVQSGNYGDLWAKAVFNICRIQHGGHDREAVDDESGKSAAGPVGQQQQQDTFFGGGSNDESAAIGSGALLTNVAQRTDPIPHINDGWAHFTRELGALLQGPQSQSYVSRLKDLPAQALEPLRSVFPML
eukprot:PhM_4_TR8063/c0_g1_i1/m.76815/K18423/CSE1, CAS, XPO2; exportin-2 (importin alpha re-exporter)